MSSVPKKYRLKKREPVEEPFLPKEEGKVLAGSPSHDEVLGKVFGTRRETYGCLLLIFALLSSLSALSFAYTPLATHWLGVVGQCLGRGWFWLAGLGSYILFGYLAWVGVELVLGKSLSSWGRSLLNIWLLYCAVGLTLSLAEDNLPQLTSWFRRYLMGTSGGGTHLAGVPLYYLYRELPGGSLLVLLNVLGVAFLAILLLAVSLLHLCGSTLAGSFRASLLYFRLGWAWVCGWWKKRVCCTMRNLAFEGSSLEEKGERRAFFGGARPLVERSYCSDIGRSSPSPVRSVLEEEDEEDELLLVPTQHRAYKMLMALVEEPLAPSQQTSSEAPAVSSASGLEGVKEKSAKEEKFSSEEAVGEPEKRTFALRAQRIYNGDFEEYALPVSALLSSPKKVDNALLSGELRRRADLLEGTLLNFGIEAKVGEIHCGPTIASFEVHPAVGVKVQRIKALEDDIALNLQAKSIRIIAPIPGKAAVGVEIPAPFSQEVGFKELLEGYRRSGHRFAIPLLLGKAVNGDFVMSDLAKMPHLIIAGATGSGKSVCINTIVMSVVLNAKPDEIRLVMVDPKKVELTPYTRLPHMLAPVITESVGAYAALQWLVKEMENRYELLKLLGVRNIEAFNHREIDEEKEGGVGREVPKKLYYIVCIVDELADLMMVSGNDLETLIARIAQMARAVGIHLILATQRPSREVITGLIKANFPARISFKVSSRVNSQIVLDEIGAEALLGNGDMLFLPPGTSHLMRAQGAYIRDEDINRVIESVSAQAPTDYVIKSFDIPSEGMSEDDGYGEGGGGALFEQAKELVLQTGQASTTFLQRKLKIGYPRAASLMDQLEQRGVVGPADGSRPRKVRRGGEGKLEEGNEGEYGYRE